MDRIRMKIIQIIMSLQLIIRLEYLNLRYPQALEDPHK